MDDCSSEHPRPWDRARMEMPAGPVVCMIDGSSRGSSIEGWVRATTLIGSYVDLTHDLVGVDGGQPAGLLTWWSRTAGARRSSVRGDGRARSARPADVPSWADCDSLAQRPAAPVGRGAPVRQGDPPGWVGGARERAVGRAATLERFMHRGVGRQGRGRGLGGRAVSGGGGRPRAGEPLTRTSTSAPGGLRRRRPRLDRGRNPRRLPAKGCGTTCAGRSRRGPRR
jgi:hypothetical protein